MATYNSAGYLGPRARLSQCWVAFPLVALVIMIVKLVMLHQMISACLDMVAKVASGECRAAQRLTNEAMNSSANAIKLCNHLISSAVNDAIRNIMDTTAVTVSVVESLILFAIEMTVGTYACLTISAVNIGANAALNATESVVSEANKTAKSIGHELNEGLGKLTKFVNGAIGLIDSVEEFVTGGDSELKSVNLTVSKLDHLNISSSINQNLEALRKDIPTYEGTKEAVASVIQSPFEQIKRMITATNVTTNFTFITSNALSKNDEVAAQCNAGKVNEVLEDIYSGVSRLTIIFCTLCCIGILCGIAFNIAVVRWRWKRFHTAAADIVKSVASPTIREKDKSDVSANPTMNGMADSGFTGFSPPVNETKVEIVLSKISTYLETSSLERWLRTRIRPAQWWLLRYALSMPIVGILVVGIIGVIISLLELAIVSLLRSGAFQIATLENEILGDAALNIERMTQQWRNQTNGEITGLENRVNSNLLDWVHNGSKGVNNSIGTFMTKINEEVGKAFNGTILLKPMMAVMNCLFENKLREAQKGLTWMYNHSHVTLPRIDQSLVPLIKDSSNLNSTVLSPTRHLASQTVENTITSLRQQIGLQFFISGIFILTWVLFCIGAALSQFSSFSSKPKITSFSTWGLPSVPRPGGGPPGTSRPRGIKRRNRPANLQPVEVSSPIKVRSPVEKLANRMTRFFSGHAHIAAMASMEPPQRASVVTLESPSTPLAAKMLKH